MNKKDILIILGIFGVALAASIRYSLVDFQIVSDSMREYNTYLQFVEMDSRWWRPITDNMLSTCIWTTYLPALIQRILRLENAELVYRITLAVLVSTTPPMIYIFARRYTGIVMSATVVIVFMTGQYYNGYASYARIIVAITFFLLLLYILTGCSRNKWIYIPLAAAGLIASHYSSSFIYGLVLLGAVALAVIAGKCRLWLTYSTVTLWAGVAVYHGFVARASRVLNYTYGGIKKMLTTYLDINMPGFTVPKAESERFYLPPPKTKSAPVETIPADSYQPPPVASANPMANERLDFAIAKVLVILRFIVMVDVLYTLVRQRRWKNPAAFVYACAVVVSTVSIWFPAIANYLGSIRQSFLSLPLELIGLTVWHEGNKDRNWLIFVLIYVSLLIYH